MQGIENHIKVFVKSFLFIVIFSFGGNSYGEEQPVLTKKSFQTGFHDRQARGRSWNNNSRPFLREFEAIWMRHKNQNLAYCSRTRRIIFCENQPRVRSREFSRLLVFYRRTLQSQRWLLFQPLSFRPGV